jgi:hypothetical protein
VPHDPEKPQTFRDHAAETFEAWLREAAGFSDKIMQQKS